MGEEGRGGEGGREDGKPVYKILVTVIPWCVAFTLALGLYFITQGL